MDEKVDQSLLGKSASGGLSQKNQSPVVAGLVEVRELEIAHVVVRA